MSLDFELIDISEIGRPLVIDLFSFSENTKLIEDAYNNDFFAYTLMVNQYCNGD